MDRHSRERAGGWWSAARRFGPGLLLVVAGLLVFGQIRDFDFVQWDDHDHLHENPHLQRDGDLRRLWQEPVHRLYIPVSYSFFALEAWISRAGQDPQSPGDGLDASVFHLGSLALHLACALLVLALLRRLRLSTGAALAGALLFALHPVQVESVAWISETRGLLASLLSLLALLGYVSFVRPPAEAGRTRPSLSYLLATLAFVLALLAKPSAVALPLLAWVLDAGLLRRKPVRAAAALLPWVVLAGLAAWYTKTLQPDESVAFVTPLWARPLIAGESLTFYLGKLVWPWPLAPDYGHTPESVLWGVWVWLAWLVPAALVLLACRGRDRRVWLTALGLFAAGVLPVLGWLPFRFQMFSTTADRYLYLSMLGPALAAGHLLVRWPRPIPVAGLSLVLLALAARSGFQTSTWRDSHTLFTHTLAVQPRSFPAHNNLCIVEFDEGSAEEGRGQPARARIHYEKAADHGQQALEIWPRDPGAHTNLARALERLGRGPEAEGHYVRALALDPRLYQAHNNLGELYLRRSQPRIAQDHFERALRIRDDLSRVHCNLGLAHHLQGRSPEAIESLSEALRLEPELAVAHLRMGIILGQQGAKARARAHLNEALRLQPGWRLAEQALAEL